MTHYTGGTPYVSPGASNVHTTYNGGLLNYQPFQTLAGPANGLLDARLKKIKGLL